MLNHHNKTMLNIMSITVVLFIAQIPLAQASQVADSTRQIYLKELKAIGKTFSNNFYPKYSAIYSLPEKSFLAMIDSSRHVFVTCLKKYSKSLDKQFLLEQQAEIQYYFDKLIVDYPNNYSTYTGRHIAVSATINRLLSKNLSDFNKPELLTNADFREYVKAFLHHQSNDELKKTSCKQQDNQQLLAVWRIIPRFFTNQQCKDFWLYEYLSNHIDNNGIKNLTAIVQDFRKTCRDSLAVRKIDTLYASDSAGRQGHVIKTYKNVGAFDLDMHLFMPDGGLNTQKRPVIIFFHGGSWSEGKPDWFFDACRNYAKRGWVACTAEYRISGRHGTLPFDAVMDAKSAIRWLRANASALNIDTAKIVASGNSAGGHLVLATALADKWNEKADDLNVSAVPNLLLVNSGVYDLTYENTKWITKDLKDKNLVEGISPNHLVKKGLPPILMIHGTKDRNCPYWTAEAFKNQMEKVGNTVELKTLEGADHFIWFNPNYAPNVSAFRSEFLQKMGY